MAEARQPSQTSAVEHGPALRGDLTFVHDNPETGDGGLRIVDPANGQHYAFDAAEQFLCLFADGQKDIETLHALLQADIGGMTLAEVQGFFARLGAMGLLDTPPEQAEQPATIPPAPPPENDTPKAKRQGLMERRRQERAGAPSQPGGEARGDLLARRRREQKDRAKADDPQPEAAPPEGTPPGRPAAGPRTGARAGVAPPLAQKAAALRDLRRGPGAARAAPSSDSARDLLARRRQELGDKSRPPEAAPGAAPEAEQARPPAPAAQAQTPDTTATATAGKDRPENRGAPPKTAPPTAPAPEAETATKAPEPEPKPEPEKTADSAAQAAMAAAQSATRKALGEPRRDTPPAAQTPAQTPATRARKPRADTAPVTYVKRGEGRGGDANSMVRRLRERANRGIAPRTGVASKPMDITPPVRRQARGAVAGDDVAQDDFNAGGAMAGGFGRGMRPGMMGGQGRAGMMGGGAGMMGGGGMRPGMMNGAMAGGGMGARGGMRGRNAAPQKPKEKMPARLHLFNPQWLLKLLYVVGYPFKYVLWMIVPLTIIAVLAVFNNVEALRADMAGAASDLSSLATLILGLFIVNLLARLAQGVAIVAHKGRVETLGFGLVLGVLPRFVIDRSQIPDLDRTGQLWGYGSVLLARLSIFCFGTLIWAITREQGGQLSLLSLLASQTALVLFLVTSFPLFPSEGQRWMAVMLNEPKLMPKMLMSLKYLLRGGRLPPMLSRQDVMPLALLGIATLLCSLALAGVIVVTALIWLERELDGLGVLLFLAGLLSFYLWFRAMLRTKRKGGRGGFDRAAFREMAMDGPAAPRRGAATADPDAAAEVDADAGLSGSAKVVWALILAGLVAVAFLPYEYYAGGQVEILPAARGQAVARSDGEIVAIEVEEGDVVSAGDVLAQLSAWDQESAVSVTQARLDGARASLARLLAGAKSEQVELARREVEAAEKEVTFFEAEAERARELVKTGTVAPAAVERAESNLVNRLADLEVARANLQLVESPPTTEEVAVAQADVARLERELEFAQGQLERTRIVAPVDGRVVSANLELRIGGYLKSGDILLEIEQSSVVRAEIHVPEADISLISLGDTVRLRTWGNAQDEILGTVATIAPAAEDETYGSVVRVGANFDNANDVLRSGMTGYAKIYGGEMRVWEAYLRSIRRFVQIEVWSWVP